MKDQGQGSFFLALVLLAGMLANLYVASRAWGFVFMRTFPPTWVDVPRITGRAIYLWPGTFLTIGLAFFSAKLCLKSFRVRDE
ncbi:hypothetical protein KJ616_02820 [Patescibacteria group bacterium]|nr:hypothetical protein [Patescibacteria group bacterium]